MAGVFKKELAKEPVKSQGKNELGNSGVISKITPQKVRPSNGCLNDDVQRTLMTVVNNVIAVFSTPSAEI